uniref:BAT2_N domain-containing protein n=1 Tax=Panagrellus redivivus TaxID=6233 RepID=A0A7E4VW63_PANRE
MNDDVKAKPKCRDDAMVIMLAPSLVLAQVLTSSDDEYVEAAEEFIVEPHQPKKKKSKKAKPKAEVANPAPVLAADVVISRHVAVEAEKDGVFVDAVEEVSIEKQPVVIEGDPEVPSVAEKAVTAEKENLPPVLEPEGFEKPKERKKKGKGGNKTAAPVVAEPVKPVPKSKQKSPAKGEANVGSEVFKMINNDDVEAGVDWATIAGDIADTPFEAEYENLPTPEELNARSRSRNNSQARSSRNRSRNSTNRSGHHGQVFVNANKAQKTRSGHSIAPPPKSGSNDVRLDRKFTPMTGANAIPVTQNVFTHANPPIIKQKNAPNVPSAPVIHANQPNPPPLMHQNLPKPAPWAPPPRPPSPAPVKHKANIFGDAKPVDTAKKLKEIEAKKFAQAGNSDGSDKSSPNGSRQSLGSQIKSSSMIIYRTGYEPDHCNQDVSTAAIHENLGPHNNQFTDAAALISKPKPPPSVASTSSRRSSQASRNNHRQQQKHSATAGVGNDVQSIVGNTTAPIPKTGNEGTGSTTPREPTNLSHQSTSSSVPKEADASMQDVVKVPPPQNQRQQPSPPFSNGSASGAPPMNGKQQGRQRRSTAPVVEYNNHHAPPPPVSQHQYYPTMPIPPPQHQPIDGQPPPPPFMFVGPLPPQQQGVRFAGPPRVMNPNMAGLPRQALINGHQVYIPGPGAPPPQHPPNGDGSGPRPMPNGVFYGPPNGANGQPTYPQSQVMPNPQMPQPQYGPSGVSPQMMAYPPPHPNQPQVRPCFVDYQNGNFQPNGPFVYMIQPNGIRVPVPINYGVVPPQGAVASQSYGSQKSASGTSNAPNTQYASVPPPGMIFPPGNYAPMVYPHPPPQPIHQVHDPTMYYGPPAAAPPPPPQAVAPAPTKETAAEGQEVEKAPEVIKESLLKKETKFNPNVPAFVPRPKLETPVAEVQPPQQNGAVNGDDSRSEESPVPPPRPLSPPPPPQQVYAQMPQQYHQPPPLMPQQYQQHPGFQHPQQQAYPRQPLPPQYYQTNGYGQPMPPQFYPNNGYIPQQHQQPPPPNPQHGYPRSNGQYSAVPYGAPPPSHDAPKPYPRQCYPPGQEPTHRHQRQGSRDYRGKQRRDGPKASATNTATPSPPESVPEDQTPPSDANINAELAPIGEPVVAASDSPVSEPNSQTNDPPETEPTEYTVDFTVQPKEDQEEPREPTPEVSVTLPLNPPPRTSNKKQRRSNNKKRR